MGEIRIGVERNLGACNLEVAEVDFFAIEIPTSVDGSPGTRADTRSKSLPIDTR